ncbi:TadE/TadG family type IV pilus assembly protein [Aureimonas flava]|nr:TadE/TadG family type IV pilus assembly protein [Aureimonas flava]
MGARSMLRRIGHFCRHDISGAGAVEFAMVVPVLLLLLLGGTELGVGLTTDRKVKAAAGAAVDLASQSLELTDSDLRKLLGIARGTLAPYSIKPLEMRLTQIKVGEDGEGTVDWSCPTTGYEKLAKGTTVTIPPEFSAVAKQQIANVLTKNHPWLKNKFSQTSQDVAVYIIRGEARYHLQPVTGQVFGDAITLTGVTYVQPRYVDQVESDTDGCAVFSLG